MADIFISYAREDQARIELLARMLSQRGWSVWWDREIPFGKAFDQVIEKELTSARCVIVAWSKISVKRNWVLEEASYGRDEEILIPVFLDEVVLPIGFRRYQAANLINWSGQEDNPEFSRFIADVELLLRSSTGDTSNKAETHTRTTIVPKDVSYRQYAANQYTANTSNGTQSGASSSRKVWKKVWNTAIILLFTGKRLLFDIIFVILSLFSALVLVFPFMFVFTNPEEFTVYDGLVMMLTQIIMFFILFKMWTTEVGIFRPVSMAFVMATIMLFELVPDTVQYGNPFYHPIKKYLVVAWIAPLVGYYLAIKTSVAGKKNI